MNWLGFEGQGVQGRYKVKRLSELVQWAEASTLTHGCRSVDYLKCSFECILYKFVTNTVFEK